MPEFEWFRGRIISPPFRPAMMRARTSAFTFEKVPHAMVSHYLDEGWIEDRRLKSQTYVRRAKSHDVAFEDRCWAMMASLGFESLNEGRDFLLRYGPGDGDFKQVDVFAMDEETIIVMECKSSQELRHRNLKSEVEALNGVAQGIRGNLRRMYPDKKIKFILATNNITVGEADEYRFEGTDILHLSDTSVEYFEQLVKHLGSAARYQFLGAVFSGVRIPGIDSRVAAVRARMGGLEYFSFFIEPSRLLKLGFILHRSKANSDLMPTYQRLIKRSRLRKIAAFVDGGGHFPNSIIVNVEGGSRGLKFEAVGQAIGNARMGVLHLPQTYRSVYVIDGQHRLYGFADSSRAETELVPVIAFVDLPRRQQVSMFMEINENQQSVAKGLQNTLNADLLWESNDLRERARALKLRIAQNLGEARRSPLYDRVLIGESVRSSRRCLTIEALTQGLDRGRFIGSFNKTQVREHGLMYTGASDSTFERVSEFLVRSFDHVRSRLPDQYKIGNGEGGYVFINVGVGALMRLFGDLVEFEAERKRINLLTVPIKSLVDVVRSHIDAACDYLGSLPSEEASQLRKQYGSGASVVYHRKLQLAVRESCPQFSPAGLDEYLQSEERRFNTDSFEIVRDIEQFLHTWIRDQLQEEFGAAWFKAGVPAKVSKAAVDLAWEKGRQLPDDQEVDPWECLHLIDYKEIIEQSHDLFVKRFQETLAEPTVPKNASWKTKVAWIAELNRIRNQNFHTYSVTEKEYAWLTDLREWLLRDD